MYSEEDLSSAIKAGVLTEEAVTAFRQHVAQKQHAPVVDEEYFRLVTGFNDVFVVIACGLLLLSVHWIGATWSAWFGALMLSLVAWGLSEFFIRQRRMALPAIMLLWAFMGGFAAISVDFTDSLAIPSALAAVAAALHWWRFKVPMTVAMGAGAMATCAVTLLVHAPFLADATQVLVFLAGLVTFSWAVRWDMRDPCRQTRCADVAFWLHLMAAPLLVHPIISWLGLFDGETHLIQALAVVALYAVVSFISLVIDRRALMVSALTYVLYAFTSLLEQYGVINLSFAITALFIGSALLMLSAYWHRSRVFVLKFCPLALQKQFAPRS